MRTALRQPYKQFFGTLANQYRLDIVHALLKESLNVGEICKRTGFKQATVSHNLRRLETCGFVFVTQNGKERVYDLNHLTIKPLLELMDSHMNVYCKKFCVRQHKKL